MFYKEKGVKIHEQCIVQRHEEKNALLGKRGSVWS